MIALPVLVTSENDSSTLLGAIEILDRMIGRPRAVDEDVIDLQHAECAIVYYFDTDDEADRAECVLDRINRGGGVYVVEQRNG